MDYTNVIKKQTQVIALSVFIMVIGILGVSYALFMKVDQSEEQTVQSGSLVMQLSPYAGSTVISNENVPVDDSEGLLTKGYSFSVTNNGTLPIKYYIALYDNPDDTSTNKLSYDYIKVSLDNGTPFTLGSMTTKDSDGRTILKQDISLAPDKYDTHNIKIWIDSETPESEIGKTISLKIYAYGEVCEDGECNGGTLPPVKKIISQLDTTGKCPTVNEDGSVNVTDKEATNGYLCKAKDAYGDSYYYRGNVTNNYVKFADKYWRIVRINGDGTVRVIYDGTSAHANGESSKDRQIGTSAFNSSYSDNAYVGYMYGNTDTIVESSEYELSTGFDGTHTFYISKEYTFDKNTKLFTLKNPIQVLDSDLTTDYIGYYYHAINTTPIPTPPSASTDYIENTPTFDMLYKIMDLTAGSSRATIKNVSYGTSSKEVAQTNTNDSTIKTYLDNWYKTNIVGTTNEQYLADNVFCNDRSISSSHDNLGYGTNVTAYRWVYGPWNSENYNKYNNKMMLMCPQKNDAFTVSDTTNGNGALTYPVGLLSTDEIVLAGGWSTPNSDYYLYSGELWWTSSPYSFSGIAALVLYEHLDASGFNSVDSHLGIRPVFNLKAEVLTYGDGTMNNPYRLTENIDSTTPSGGGSSASGDIGDGHGEVGS